MLLLWLLPFETCSLLPPRTLGLGTRSRTLKLAFLRHVQGLRIGYGIGGVGVYMYIPGMS